MVNRVSKIKPLPQTVISAIAAGEVADRPASVVKELVENSLDAAASSIEIVIQKSGMKLIQVYDNGKGMSIDDLKICFQKHTTSKIRNVQDLERITSLGFRGEALASIAAAGQLTIQSRTLDQNVGNLLEITNELPGKITQIGMPRGTMITVNNLYDQIPARKKFLKEPKTELRKIVELITRMALSHPQVGFSLLHHNKRLIHTPKGQSMADRVANLFGEDIINHLIPILQQREFFSVEGVLGSLQVSQKTNRKQYLFINGRSISHSKISQAIKQGYGTLLEPQDQPFFILHVNLPAKLFDANVHPQKSTVTFMDEADVLKLIQDVVSQAISKNDFDFKYSPKTPHSLLKLKDSTATPLLMAALKNRGEAWNLKNIDDKTTIQQIDDTYLIVPKDDGFVIIDQHAAHERILFEQYTKIFDEEKGNLPPHKLEQAHALTLSPDEAQLMTEYQDQLEKIGFKFEDFGGNTFKISHVPSYLRDNDPSRVIRSLLDDLVSDISDEAEMDANKQTLLYLACRSAIMAGEALAQEERKNLVEKLMKTDNRATCPHGRPTMVHFSIDDLEKMFKRS